MLISFLLVAVLAACGSGSDLEVTLTSLASGTVETLSYTLNGGEPRALTLADNTFAFEVALLRAENTITVSAAGSGGETAEASVTVTPQV